MVGGLGYAPKFEGYKPPALTIELATHMVGVTRLARARELNLSYPKAACCYLQTTLR